MCHKGLVGAEGRNLVAVHTLVMTGMALEMWQRNLVAEAGSQDLVDCTRLA